MPPPFRSNDHFSMPSYVNSGESIVHRLSFHQPGHLGIRDHLNKELGTNENMASGYQRTSLPAPGCQPLQSGQVWPVQAPMGPAAYHMSGSSMNQGSDMNMMQSFQWSAGGFPDGQALLAQPIFNMPPNANIWPHQAVAFDQSRSC